MDQIKDLTAQTTGAISFIFPVSPTKSGKAPVCVNVHPVVTHTARCFSASCFRYFISPVVCLPHNNSAALAGAAAPRG